MELNLKCYKCNNKVRALFLSKCDCGIVYCIKHRFHDCQRDKHLILPEKIEFVKITKI